MSEKLLNVKEVCRYLDISEDDLRNLVERGEIPAYRLGGTILRFRKGQIDIIKSQGITKVEKRESSSGPVNQRWEKIKDFLYFNDFYIISAIISVVLLIVIFFVK